MTFPPLLSVHSGRAHRHWTLCNQSHQGVLPGECVPRQAQSCDKTTEGSYSTAAHEVVAREGGGHTPLQLGRSKDL